MQVVSPFLVFPSTGWWMQVIDAHTLTLDGAEHYVKMTDRNRYRIAGANNTVLLTVPLTHGREQRVAMNNVRIANDYRWQIQHWRTIVSAYNRSPFFSYYEPELARMYEEEYTHLTQFCRATIEWTRKQLKLPFAIEETTTWQPEYPGLTDLRHVRTYDAGTHTYYQVFAERFGFIPGLSILDLLFSEGPHAVAWLRAARTQ